ncbi:MAG: hypothetical protein ACRDPI_05855 [Nocardioidaceae bacterium]
MARDERATGAEEEPLEELFETSFVTGSPKGSSVVTREMLAPTTRSRRATMGSLGPKKTRLTDLEVEWLGSAYCLAKTAWQIEVAPAGREPVALTAYSDFVLQSRDGRLTVVTYLARQDFDEELRAALG